MMHFKNHKPGFTLVEVILALAITALVLTPIFIMHAMIFQRVSRSSQDFEVLMYCKNLLYEARQKQEVDTQEFTLEKGMVDFSGTRTYRLESGVDAKSSLHGIVGLHKESVTLNWTYLGEKKREQLVNFVYKNPPAGKQSLQGSP